MGKLQYKYDAPVKLEENTLKHLLRKKSSKEGDPYLPVEKFRIRRPFKNGEMQGSEKILGAQCIAHT